MERTSTEKILFVYPPSDSLLCPVHKGLFVFAVIAKCGHTFCRDCISQTSRCPIDQTPIRVPDELIPNLAVSGQINDLLVHCKYGVTQANGEWESDPNGCQQKIKYGFRGDHEDKCDFAPARCPYSEQCVILRRSELKAHLETCTHIPCPHYNAGCPFEGNKKAVDDHLLNCKYESIKDYIVRSEEQVIALKSYLEEKASENEYLKKTMIQLSNKFDQLASKLEVKNSKFEASLRHLHTSLEATQSQLADTLSELQSIKKYADRAPDDIEQQVAGQQLLKCKGTIAGHNGPVWALCVANGGLISGSSDNTIKVWDLATFKCKQTLTGHEGIVHALAVIGNILFSGSSDKKIRVWDLETNECIRILEDHDDTICALSVAAGYLFSGSYTHIKVWDLETYKCVDTLKGHNHWVRAITVSSGFLFSGSHNIIKIWDLGTLQCVKTIAGNCGSIYAIVVANRRLITGVYENAIIVWDLDSYELTHRLAGHIGAVYTLGFHGNRLFSGSYDSTIKVWNLDTLQCVQTLNRHTSSVDALVSYHANVYSGSADNTIKVWR